MAVKKKTEVKVNIDESVKKKRKILRLSPWKNNDFVEYARELINDGILKEDSGENKLFQKLTEWLSEKDDYRVIKKGELKTHWDKMVWPTERLKIIEAFTGMQIGFTGVYEALSFLPKVVIDWKVKQLHGTREYTRRQKRFSIGFGKLLESEEVAAEVAAHGRDDLSLTTPTDPFVVEVKDKDSYSVLVLNGLHIGASHNPIIKYNPMRNALMDAQHNRDDAVIVAGSLMWLDLKKASGSLTTHRALLSGINFDESVIDDAYLDEAKRIRLNLPSDEVGFLTLRQRFENVSHGLRKITTDDKNNALYKGSVYVFLGRAEEEFIENAAQAEIRYIVAVQRYKKQCEIKAMKSLLAHELKQSGGERTEELERYEKEIERLTSIEKRMIVTNVDPDDYRRFVDIVRSWVVKSYEQAIPNCKVVAQGTSFMKIGDKVIEVHQDRKERPNNKFLHEYLTKNAGKRELEGSLPDAVLLSGPYNVNFRWAQKERINGGEQISVPVWQLPILLDKGLLKRKLNRQVREGSPFERLLHHPEFEPGAFRFGNQNGVWLSQPLAIEQLVEWQEYQKRNQRRIGNGSSYIYVFVDSDNHFGHPWKYYVYDNKANRYLGFESAVIEMWRKSGLFGSGRLSPIHSCQFLGDRTQGHHFQTEAQPHQYIDRYQEIENRANELLKRKSASNPDMVRKLIDDMLEQIRLRGIHWPQAQAIDVFFNFLLPNVDFFTSVIKRSRKSKVVCKGVGQVCQDRSDSRDIGIITDLSGNHFAKSMDNQITEFFYSQQLALMVYAFQPRSKKKLSLNDINELIKAPVFGNSGIGWGFLSAKNRYDWGLSLRHDPVSKGGQNGDPLRRTLKKVLERGNYAGIFERKRTLHLSGDVHRYGAVHGPMVTVINCASGTVSDPYGERGFSLNNTGNMVIGLPVDGPVAGPIRIIPFTHDFVQGWFNNQREIDWEKIFVNPV